MHIEIAQTELERRTLARNRSLGLNPPESKGLRYELTAKANG